MTKTDFNFHFDKRKCETIYSVSKKRNRLTNHPPSPPLLTLRAHTHTENSVKYTFNVYIFVKFSQ